MKEKMFVVEKIFVKKTFVKTFYGLNDDYYIDDIKTYPIVNKKIVGIFKDKILTEKYLSKKNINASIKYNGNINQDLTSGVEGKCTIKGFYHNVEEKELETVFIVNELFAKIGNDLISIDETIVSNNQKEIDEEYDV